MLGFTVAKPWGDSNRYDLAVYYEPGFWRVQVKLTTHRVGSRYRLAVKGPRHPAYTKKEIDFLDAYVMPANVWYVIPIEAFVGRTALEDPGGKKGKY